MSRQWLKTDKFHLPRHHRNGDLPLMRSGSSFAPAARSSLAGTMLTQKNGPRGPLLRTAHCQSSVGRCQSKMATWESGKVTAPVKKKTSHSRVCETAQRAQKWHWLPANDVGGIIGKDADTTPYCLPADNSTAIAVAILRDFGSQPCLQACAVAGSFAID